MNHPFFSGHKKVLMTIPFHSVLVTIPFHSLQISYNSRIKEFLSFSLSHFFSLHSLRNQKSNKMIIGIGEERSKEREEKEKKEEEIKWNFWGIVVRTVIRLDNELSSDIISFFHSLSNDGHISKIKLPFERTFSSISILSISILFISQIPWKDCWFKDRTFERKRIVVELHIFVLNWISTQVKSRNVFSSLLPFFFVFAQMIRVEKTGNWVQREKKRIREEERKEMKTQGGKKQEEKDDMITVTFSPSPLFHSLSHSFSSWFSLSLEVKWQIMSYFLPLTNSNALLNITLCFMPSFSKKTKSTLSLSHS